MLAVNAGHTGGASLCEWCAVTKYWGIRLGVFCFSNPRLGGRIGLNFSFVHPQNLYKVQPGLPERSEMISTLDKNAPFFFLCYKDPFGTQNHFVVPNHFALLTPRTGSILVWLENKSQRAQKNSTTLVKKIM